MLIYDGDRSAHAIAYSRLTTWFKVYTCSGRGMFVSIGVGRALQCLNDLDIRIQEAIHTIGHTLLLNDIQIAIRDGLVDTFFKAHIGEFMDRHLYF